MLSNLQRMVLHLKMSGNFLRQHRKKYRKALRKNKNINRDTIKNRVEQEIKKRKNKKLKLTTPSIGLPDNGKKVTELLESKKGFVL